MIHKSAYLLDPRYHGELLSDEDKLAAIQFVCELAEKFSTSELLDVDSLKVQLDVVKHLVSAFSCKCINLTSCKVD